MTKSNLKTMVKASENGNRFLFLKIETEGNPAPEIIVNPPENIASKMAYIDKAYNEELELIRAKESGKRIRIVDAVVTSNFNALSWFVY